MHGGTVYVWADNEESCVSTKQFYFGRRGVGQNQKGISVAPTDSHDAFTGLRRLAGVLRLFDQLPGLLPSHGRFLQFQVCPNQPKNFGHGTRLCMRKTPRLYTCKLEG